MSKLVLLSALVLFVKLINATPIAETSSKNLESTFIGCIIITVLLGVYVILDITKCKNLHFLDVERAIESLKFSSMSSMFPPQGSDRQRRSDFEITEGMI